MTFQEFVLSRRYVASMGAHNGDPLAAGVPGFVYAGGFCVEHVTDPADAIGGQYRVMIWWDTVQGDLETCERRLYLFALEETDSEYAALLDQIGNSEDGMDADLGRVQDHIGVESGDYASQHFPVSRLPQTHDGRFLDDGELYWISQADSELRERVIGDYVESEILHWIQYPAFAPVPHIPRTRAPLVAAWFFRGCV